MANCILLLNNGDDVLLNTGDQVLLNDDTCQVVIPHDIGINLVGDHSRPTLFSSRPQQSLQSSHSD